MTTSHIKVRVNSTIKSDAVRTLNDLDVSMNQLVTSALEYVIDNRKLPTSRGGLFDGVRDWLISCKS